jgi:vacuolar-type H+-ATPase catalytic subunit A/Vma1
LGRNSEEPAITCQLSALSQNPYQETGAVTITLNHFSAAAVFALFASVVFGITHRETTRDMVRYGLYCFAMFLGGAIVAGWAMWLLRR